MALIQKQVNKPADEWANDVLFSKIGLSEYNWVRYKDGITLGGFVIETTPRGLAKIALCVANRGAVMRDQVVSSSWVDEMVYPHIEVENLAYSFGFNWWIDEQSDIHFMWGHGGQFAFIDPSTNLLVVMTAFPNTQGDYQIIADEAIPFVKQIKTAIYE